MLEVNEPPFPGAYLDNLPAILPHNPELPYQPAMQFEEVAVLHGTIVRLMNEVASRKAETERHLAKAADLYEFRMREKEARLQIAEEARYDPKLHYLLTPVAFVDRVSQRIAHADRAEDKLGANFLLVIDIDHFKTTVNDPLGHLPGDTVLLETARQLRANVREEDEVCRWGGEEFAAFIHGTTLLNAVQIAHRYQMALRERTVGEIVQDVPVPKSAPEDLLKLYPTVSIGIAELPQPAGIEGFKAAYSDADTAMYAVKRHAVSPRDGIAYSQGGALTFVKRGPNDELFLPE